MSLHVRLQRWGQLENKVALIALVMSTALGLLKPLRRFCKLGVLLTILLLFYFWEKESEVIKKSEDFRSNLVSHDVRTHRVTPSALEKTTLLLKIIPDISKTQPEETAQRSNLMKTIKLKSQNSTRSKIQVKIQTELQPKILMIAAHLGSYPTQGSSWSFHISLIRCVKMHILNITHYFYSWRNL